MEITAKQVMELRQATGMPMMTCKKALIEAEGDFERGMEILRKEGLKTADKKAGRKTGEGLIAVRLADDRKSGTMVQVLCESEPVKNTPLFKNFVDALAAHAHQHKPADVEALLAQPWSGEGAATVEEALRNLIAQIGENMKIGGVAHFDVDDGGLVGAYVHLDKKQGALVAIQGRGDDLATTAKEVCQHIVFAKPQVLSRDAIPADQVQRELAFLREQAAEDPALKGKPQQAVEGIVQGRLNKNFFAERALLEQGWYRENAKKVSAVLEERKVSIQGFALFHPGQ
jgi:elongation factor Ts